MSGNYKTQLWVKSCVLKMCSERAFVLWTSSGPFCKSAWAFWGIGWEWVCKYQIALQMLMSSEIAQCIRLWSSLCSAQAPSFLSSSCCYKVISLPFKRKSLFSFVIYWKSSSSSSSFFIFFNGPSFVILFYFISFYLSNLIWEIHFEGRDSINKTPSNTDLLPKPPSTNTDLKFLFYQAEKKKF